MRRRTVVLGGAASAMLPMPIALAQQRVYRIGVLHAMGGQAAAGRLTTLRERLSTHGFIEGRNLKILSFSSTESLRDAREVVKQKPDAIVSLGTYLTQALKAATSTIPVVFVWEPDPVASGLLEDLARPSGNITGVTNRSFELLAKRLEMVRELLPSAKRVMIASHGWDAAALAAMKFAHKAAQRLQIDLVSAEALAWGRVVGAAVSGGVHALVILKSFAELGILMTAHQVVSDTIEQCLPAIFSDVETVAMGGLMSYATNLSDDLRRAADLVARILRGEKPGGLPVDQAARFELAINLKTARAIGLKIPQSLLVRADKVIE